MNGIFRVPVPSNEPLLGYAPGSAEKKALKDQLKKMLSEEIEIPLVIGGKEVRTGDMADCRCPHDHGHLLARYHKAKAAEVEMAVVEAKKAWKEWSENDDVTDFSNFMAAVIDKAAFGDIVEYIEFAKKSSEAEIICGGGYDGSKGYFIGPTVVVAKNPKFKLMQEEIFGPVLTVYVYPEAEFKKALELCDTTSPYGLTMPSERPSHRMIGTSGAEIGGARQILSTGLNSCPWRRGSNLETNV